EPIVSNAYIEPLGENVSPALINAATKHSPVLTYLSIMSYRVNRDGTLNRPPLDHLPDIAQAANASLALVVTNLEEGQFSADLDPIVSNAYIEPIGENVSPALINAATKHSPVLTYLSIMSYRVNRDGTLNRPPLDQLPDIAQAANASLALVVTNLEEGQFSAE